MGGFGILAPLKRGVAMGGPAMKLEGLNPREEPRMGRVALLKAAREVSEQ